MPWWLDTLLFLIAYLTVGFIITRISLPHFIRNRTIHRGQAFSEYDDGGYQLAKSTVLKHDRVAQDTYYMTFLWPAYLPITLTHAMAQKQLKTYDPNEIQSLQHQLDVLQTRQLRKGISQERDPQ